MIIMGKEVFHPGHRHAEMQKSVLKNFSGLIFFKTFTGNTAAMYLKQQYRYAL